MGIKQFAILIFILSGSFLSAQSIVDISDSTIHASFRGLSVVDDNVVWVSGSNGTVGVSIDGGVTWQWKTVKDFEALDFRSLYAFDGKRAIIASAGTPSVILTTADGGTTWTQRYRSDDTLMFLDGIDFWDNKHGMIFGDPIGGKMFIAETFDAGKTWEEIPAEDCPQLVPGEAAFAASGTTIRTVNRNEVYIATGGTKSRLWYSSDYGHHWIAKETSIIQGRSSQGIFSFVVYGETQVAIIGGDYMQDTLSLNNWFFSGYKGDSWGVIGNNPAGYRSCVELVHIGKSVRWVCTGPTGTEIMLNGTWQQLSPTGYHCVSQANNGRSVYFSGSKGKIGKLKIE